jgi:hypothetical protein
MPMKRIPASEEVRKGLEGLLWSGEYKPKVMAESSEIMMRLLKKL